MALRLDLLMQLLALADGFGLLGSYSDRFGLLVFCRPMPDGGDIHSVHMGGKLQRFALLDLAGVGDCIDQASFDDQPGKRDRPADSQEWFGSRIFSAALIDQPDSRATARP